MSQEDTAPIVVNSSAAGSLLMTAVRAVLTPVAASLATNGYITGDQGDAIIGGAVALAVVLWQLYVSKSKHAKMRTLANEAPNYVAQVK